MKRVLSLLVLGLCINGYSQSHTHGEHCKSDHLFFQALGEHPEMQVEFDDFNKFVEENGEMLSNQRAVKIIPTVVHIIHNYGPENVSDARVADAIRYLNEDFMGTSTDLANIVPSFSGIAGNPQFEFRLATLDPNGNCTNGITRTQSLLTYDADDGDRNAKVISWPRNKYYNIWVVYNIYSDSPGSVTAGYSYFPSNMYPAANLDGTLLSYSYFGLASPAFQKRVLSHETGHWFRLAHTFGNVAVDQGDCSGTDDVSDTSPTPGSFSTCNLARTGCSVLENVENIMDYSSCTKMFTQGQSTRMIAAANSSTAGRNNLWTNSNLIATGTSTVTPSSCAPIADFNANRYSICAGSTITFYDNTWNAAVTSRQWTFSNGVTTINDSTENPIITFNQPGVYDVTLTSSAPGGNDTETRTDYVYVYDANAANTVGPFVESFENAPISSGNWAVLYNQDPVDGWRVTNSAYVSSNTSLMVHNYSLSRGQLHTILSPSYDFTAIGTPTMTFKYAYARKNSDNNDLLKVYISTNCGQTWVVRGNYDAEDILTGGIKTNDWYPNSGQWATKTVNNLSGYANKENVRFKFEFTSDGGNNLFIDDINITGPLGLEDATNNDLQLTVYPNPAKDIINIDFSVDKDYQAVFRLVDIAGKQLATLGIMELIQGDNHLTFNVPAGTTTGLYFLQMEAGGKVFTKKIIIE